MRVDSVTSDPDEAPDVSSEWTDRSGEGGDPEARPRRPRSKARGRPRSKAAATPKQGRGEPKAKPAVLSA